MTAANQAKRDGRASAGSGALRGRRFWCLPGLALLAPMGISGEAHAQCVPVALQRQPSSHETCPTGSAMFAVLATGTSPFFYQWQLQTAPEVWQGMGNDPFPLPCGGGAFAYASPIDSPAVTIGIRPCPGTPGVPQRFQIRCVVSNDCGTITSNEATYTICPADINCDGQLNVGDLLSFLSFYAAADAHADFDASGQIDVADFLAFLSAYATGC
jgi:hypothetical protein